jgi:hypothetical protein
MVPQSELLDSHPCALIESFLIGAKYDDYKNAVGSSLKRHEDIEKDENSSKEQKEYSDRIVQISTSFNGFRNSINLDSLKHRIEMVEGFKFSS